MIAPINPGANIYCAHAGESLWRYFKIELMPADVGYRELAERLKKRGMSETETSIANKISRGTFSATLTSLIAIDAGTVRLEDI